MPIVSTPATPNTTQAPIDAAVEAALHQAWQASARAEAESASAQAAKVAAQQSAVSKRPSSLYLQPDENYDQAARLRSIMAHYNNSGGAIASSMANGLRGSTVVQPQRGTPAGIVESNNHVVRVTHAVTPANGSSTLVPHVVRPAVRPPAEGVQVVSREQPGVKHVLLPTTAGPSCVVPSRATHVSEVAVAVAPPTQLPEPLACNIPVIAITSGKGGVGKSSLSVNIASCLAGMRVRTTLIDADPGLANVDLLCGISPTTRLESVLATGGARRSMSTIAVQTPAGFALVPGSAGLARMADLGPADRVQLLSAMTELESSSDVLLIDTGAGLSESVLAFVKHADFAVVVATPEPTSIADAYAMIKLLHAAHKPEPAGVRAAAGGLPKRGGVLLVINQAASQAEAMQVYHRITATTQRFLGCAPELLGWVVHDDAMRAAVRARTPITAYQPNSPASKHLQKLASELAVRAGLGAHAMHQAATPRGLKSFLARVMGK